MGSRFKAVATAVVMAVLASGGVLAATAGPAGAAVPTCNEATRKYSVSNQYMFIPVYYSTLSPQCNMRRGNKNNGVKYLQRVMRDQYDYAIAVDGDFGPATENALKALQRRLGISADGVYGPQTRDAICWPLWEYPDSCWWYNR